MLRFQRLRMIVLLILNLSVLACSEASAVWRSIQNGAEDLEFGIVSLVDGNQVFGPSAIETGYSGGYGIPIPNYYPGGSDVIGVGQTFVVDSASLLSAVQLRLAPFSTAVTPSGEITVSVSEFDPATSQEGTTLAATSVDASIFAASWFSTPVFEADLMSAGAELNPGQTYMLSVSTSGYGAHIFAHGATDIYTGGNSYLLAQDAAVNAVPEPSSIVIFAGCAFLLGLAIKHRKY